MNHFEWRFIRRLGESYFRYCILEVNELGGTCFWGILEEDDHLYRPVIINKYRNGYIEVKEYMTFSEAKLVTEKKLMDEGIISEGCELVDYTE